MAEVPAYPQYAHVTPEYVNNLSGPVPSEVFLCPLSANVYKIDFLAFKIRAVDDNSETVLFSVEKGPEEVDLPDDDSDPSVRRIQYQFGPHFLEYQTIGTSLEFRIGDQPVRNLRMIERHYFRDILIKSFDFSLPFVIPNTTNTWEVVYTMPELDPNIKKMIIQCPWETVSDSFYFVEDRLVMHNKAEYDFSLSP